MRDWHAFLWQSLEILNIFNTLTLKQMFWKTKTFSKILEHRFLVESTKIKIATFPYKRQWQKVLSEDNVKTNRIGSSKLTYPNERNFTSIYFTFFKILFQYKNLYNEMNWCTNYPNVHIHVFFTQSISDKYWVSLS